MTYDITVEGKNYMAVNISKVYLLNIPLEDDLQNTLYFSNATNQYNYFNNNIGKTYNNVSYQSETRTFRCPDQIDTIRNYNYIMWQNTAYSNKWFYAFIKRMEYVNDGYTDIQFEVDPIQTFMFDYEVKPSFIEREHTADDTVGNNTQPENVELGEYVSNGYSNVPEFNNLAYIIQVTEWTTGSSDKPLATDFGGVFAPGGAYICSNITEAINIINAYQNGREKAITNVYVVPKSIVNNTSGTLQYSGQSLPVTITKTIAKQTTLNGYTPRNAKLKTYPYNYLILDNNNGSSNVLQYEQFNTENCTFNIVGVPTVGGSIKCIPTNYKGLNENQQEGIMCGKYPTCGWINDTYTNWLTQNGVNIGLGVVSSGLSIVGGLALMSTGAGAMAGGSSVVSGAMGIAQSIGQVYQHEILPNSASGNTNGGDIATCAKINSFYFIKMSIKAEYARVIDEYFDMYGYKTNRVKTPNVAHRQNWWYTKTINANIVGDIPNEYINKIKDAYNNGLTFWRNPSNFLNYSVSNGIL